MYLIRTTPMFKGTPTPVQLLSVFKQRVLFKDWQQILTYVYIQFRTRLHNDKLCMAPTCEGTAIFELIFLPSSVSSSMDTSSHLCNYLIAASKRMDTLVGKGNPIIKVFASPVDWSLLHKTRIIAP